MECAKHGTATWEPSQPKPTAQAFIPGAMASSYGAPAGPIQIRKRNMTPKVDTSQEIVEDYGEVIREARERLGYTHEDLAKKINEKDSLLRKVETSKLAPNLQLISKLEHTLKIKLLVPVAEEKTPVPHVASRELTLGDLMPTVRKGKGEDTAQRKP